MDLRIIQTVCVLIIAGSLCWTALLLPVDVAASRLGKPELVRSLALFLVLILTGAIVVMILKRKRSARMHNSARNRIATVALVLLAAASLTTACAASANRDWVRATITRLFGPPAVQSNEAYEHRSDGPTFDHSTFDALLRKHVDEHGWIHYKGFKEDGPALDKYLASIRNAPFDKLDRDEKLTLLINAYNAFTIQLIIENLPLDSIRDIPDAKRWDATRWNIGGNIWSLNEIEHEQIRPKFEEPLIHFALVCAARSCPPLRNGAYTADRLDEQLASQAKYAHTHDRWLRVDTEKETVHMTELYNWYAGDFEQAADSVLAFAASYNDVLARLLEQNPKPRIKWIPYSWDLNSVENRPEGK